MRTLHRSVDFFQFFSKYDSTENLSLPKNAFKQSQQVSLPLFCYSQYFHPCLSPCSPR